MPTDCSEQAVSNPKSAVTDLRMWYPVIGPIPWGHSGPLCHALSLTSMRRRRTTVPLATSGELA